MKKLFFSTGLIVIFFLGLMIYWATTPCTMDREYSMKRVLKHLERHGLNPIYLREDRMHDEPCALSYVYRNEIENIHFMVIEGHKVTWWDISERGPIYKEHNKTLEDE